VLLSALLLALQDFPPKVAGTAAAAVSGFVSCLTDYITALKLPGLWAGDVARLVAGADFSAARAALLPSVPGYHAGAGGCAHSGGVAPTFL
jgi:hypothetical protein